MSRKILVIGAGKSTSYLLDYLLEKADSENLFLTIGDLNPGIVPDEIKNNPSCKVIRLDIFEDDERDMAIKNSDIVISMPPVNDSNNNILPPLPLILFINCIALI